MRPVIGITGDRIRVANGENSATDPDGSEDLQLHVDDDGKLMALNDEQVAAYAELRAVRAESAKQPTDPDAVDRIHANERESDRQTWDR